MIKGAQNEVGAQKFIDHLLTKTVQADIPGQMYMYPVDSSVELFADWVKFAPLAPKLIAVDPTTIAISASRDQGLDGYVLRLTPVSATSVEGLGANGFSLVGIRPVPAALSGMAALVLLVFLLAFFAWAGLDADRARLCPRRRYRDGCRRLTFGSVRTLRIVRTT